MSTQLMDPSKRLFRYAKDFLMTFKNVNMLLYNVMLKMHLTLTNVAFTTELFGPLSSDSPVRPHLLIPLGSEGTPVSTNIVKKNNVQMFTRQCITLTVTLQPVQSCALFMQQ